MGVNEGVNITPRGQISPLGAGGEVKNGPWPLEPWGFGECSPMCDIFTLALFLPSQLARCFYRSFANLSPSVYILIGPGTDVMIF
jgi:hypothetical protein